jgi:hypothetical protein
MSSPQPISRSSTASKNRQERLSLQNYQIFLLQLPVACIPISQKLTERQRDENIAV